jgi:hypothetical protein
MLGLKLRAIYQALIILICNSALISGCLNATVSPTLNPAPLTAPPIVERNPLDSDACSPPCWQTIVPGVTSEPEARRVLQKRAGLSTDSCQSTLVDQNSGMTNCTGINLNFYRASNVVFQIGFGPIPAVTIEKFIDKYGPPSGISIGTQGVELISTSIITYFPSQSMTVKLDRNGSDYDIQPYDTITWVSYVAPDAVPSELLSILKPWKGYGDYSQYVNQ